MKQQGLFFRKLVAKYLLVKRRKNYAGDRQNSYERIYDVNLDMISKILNNTKFKYNLNKLNNIDFL